MHGNKRTKRRKMVTEMERERRGGGEKRIRPRGEKNNWTKEEREINEEKERKRQGEEA